MKLPASFEKNRRALTLVVALICAWLLFLYGIKPYRAALLSAKTGLDAEQALLIRERNAVATAKQNPMLQQMTDSALHAMEPRLFDGHDDVIATSELAAYLGTVARDNKVYLQDAVTRPSSELTEGVRNLRVDIRAESDFQGILSFITSLETGDKLLRIERMDISRTQRSTTGSLATPDDVETISMQATVSGYAMGALSTPQAVKPGAKPAAAGTRAAPAPIVSGGK